MSGGVLGNSSSAVMTKAMPLPSALLNVGGARVHLREPSKKDAAEWARLRRAGRAHLEPWEPQITEQWDTAYQPRRWKRIVRAQREARKAGTALPMVIDVDGRFAGEATIGGIVRGANQSAGTNTPAPGSDRRRWRSLWTSPSIRCACSASRPR